MLIRFVVCCYIAIARLTELAFSKRNIASFPDSEEGAWSKRTFPLVVALHTAVLACTLLFGIRPRKFWLVVLLLTQPVRFWVLKTLGRRWNARAAVPSEMEVETRGPYAYVRHPNYTVVEIEIFSLPAAFGLTQFALATSLANAVLLAIRVHDEEALLFSLPGYGEHFSDKPRFLPGLF